MLNRIANQVRTIEKYLTKVTVTASQQYTTNKQKPSDETQSYLSENKELEYNRLRYIVKLLKQTYQVLQNEGMTPVLSLQHINEILLKVFWIITELKQTNTEPIDTTYSQLLINTLDWVKKETDLSSYLHVVADTQEGVQIVLPIRQAYDKQVGIGKCGGYVEKWAHDMYLYDEWLMRGHIDKEEMKASSILNKIPFHGIANTHFPLIIAPNPSSKFLHLAPITNEIRDLQSAQYKFWSKKNPLHINKAVQTFRFLSTAKNLADKLMVVANNHMNEVIHIILSHRVLLLGHILGLMKTNDHYYHFLDANGGYYRFHNANDFKEWFPNYFHSKNYNFTFFAIQIIPSPNTVKQIHYPSVIKLNAAHTASAIILSSFAILRGILKPQHIYGYVTTYKHALAAENKQLHEKKNEIYTNKIEAHTASPTYYKSQLWFSDDMRLEMKRFPRREHKASSEDDIALLPRFHSSKKI